MKARGTWQIVLGGLTLFATLFVLPSSLYDVVSGTAEGGGVALFVLGLVLLTGGLVLLGVGMIKRSQNLRSARSYETREASIPDSGRPENPSVLPSALTQHQAGSPPPQY